jgi:UDP-N-acetylglucosamine 1-carboxyvinyltransferase
MMAAVLAEGQTIIRNAAREPEIVDLQNFLNSMGAHIIGAGLDCIRIDGVKSLRGVSHGVIPDRIEAGTHLVAVAIAGGEVLVNQIIAEHIEPAVAKLREAGMEFEPAGSGMLVRCRRPLRPINIKTMPYPGFPTDLQPQFMALMSVTEGTSVIIESIFENRFKHVPELRRMGGDISVEGRVSVVKGVEKLSGTVVEATDLRAGAALVLAGLAAEGVTEIEGIEHIDRGYEGMEDKYRAIGADIRRIG